MKRRIVEALTITAAIAISMPISPAKAQITGGFNPIENIPNFNNLGLPSSGSDLNSILGNSGGILGGNNSGGLGGILGGDSGGLGSILGGDSGGLSGILGGSSGGGSSGSSGGDLSSILQGYLKNFLQMAQSAIGDAVGNVVGGLVGGNTAPGSGSGSTPKDPGLGETLSHVTIAMKSNTGGLGLPDYLKSREEAIANAKTDQNPEAMVPFSGINLTTLQPGQINSTERNHGFRVLVGFGIGDRFFAR